MRLLRHIFAFYFLLVFVISFFIFIPPYFFVFLFSDKKNAPHNAHKISRSWAKSLFAVGLLRTDIRNRHYIDPQETYVIISNHRSQLDIPLNAIACKNTIRFLAKQELTKFPFLGYVIKKVYLTVNREDRADRNRAIERMKESIAEGISVFIYPEGTRNRTSQPLLSFRDGAFRLAIETQIPLAILTIINADRINSPLLPFQLSPGTMLAVWDKPVSTKGMTQNDIPKLKQIATEIILKNLKKYENTV